MAKVVSKGLTCSIFIVVGQVGLDGANQHWELLPLHTKGTTACCLSHGDHALALA